MTNAAPKLRFKALPVQLIPMNAGLIIRRGASQVKIDGERAVEVVEQIIKTASEGVFIEEIVRHFKEIDRPSVVSLVDFLIARNFLIPCGDGHATSPERPLDIFYWNFNPSMETVSTRISGTKLAIIGVNTLTRELLSALGKSNFQHVAVVDHPDVHDPASVWGDDINKPIAYEQWNRPASWESLQCIVVCSDVGGGDLLHELNNECLSRGMYFLPVVQRDLIGFVGPLVLPGETACYECLFRRENSNLTDALLGRTVEYCKPVDARRVLGYHPTMYSVLANLAAFELMRFFSQSLPGIGNGILIEVNLLATTVKTRKVLKVPRCRSCSSMMNTPSISPYTNDVTNDIVKAHDEKS